MGGHIFINYRRDDSSASAGRLYDRLSSHFSANQVFFDIDNLPLGVDFADVIEENVGSCHVQIAIIATLDSLMKEANGAVAQQIMNSK